MVSSEDPDVFGTDGGYKHIGNQFEVLGSCMIQNCHHTTFFALPKKSETHSSIFSS